MLVLQLSTNLLSHAILSGKYMVVLKTTVFFFVIFLSCVREYERRKISSSLYFSVRIIEIDFVYIACIFETVCVESIRAKISGKDDSFGVVIIVITFNGYSG